MKTLFVAFLYLMATPAWSLDPVEMISDLVPRDNLPRQLNVADLPEIDATNPQPLITPVGDFNGDQILDKAISGTYDLYDGKRRYFLLVGTRYPNQSSFTKIFFKEFAMPIYLFYPGTTGQGDPGDQAFSLSQCYQCDKGWDFYWNSSKNSFKRVRWSQKIKRISVSQPEPTLQVPPDQIDKALKIVGILPDIQEFVKDLKEKGSQLGTRVQYKNKKKRKNIYKVSVYEKKAKEELIYDVLLVNTDKGKILKRKKKNVKKN